MPSSSIYRVTARDSNELARCDLLANKHSTPATPHDEDKSHIAALAYASDAAAFLTEAYVHPGPRMPPPETGRDDLAPGLAHAIVAVLIYALLARRRRCCESKQRSGKRE